MAAGKPAEQLAIPVRLKAHGALWNRSSVGRRLKHLCGPFHRWKHIPSPASAPRRTNVAGADLPPAVHKLPPAKEKEQYCRGGNHTSQRDGNKHGKGRRGVGFSGGL